MSRIADSPWLWRQEKPKPNACHEFDDMGWCKHCGTSRFALSFLGNVDEAKCSARVIGIVLASPKPDMIEINGLQLFVTHPDCTQEELEWVEARLAELG